MKKIFTSASFIFTFIITANAQDTTYWKRGGMFSVNMNQVSFSNWSAGGDNSFSVTGLFSSFLNYKREKIAWDNSIDLGYGFVKILDNPVRKNEDRIIIYCHPTKIKNSEKRALQ
ncbi:MAG: DUF3078 domain-containing protein [Cytophagaceae bacterium]|nr:DUF3078 domain-containing protein [Cytophagaceae bacterium]